ncbi:MAG: sugar ABC transporter substrate-binding protein [Propionibacteriales bacterium]|nr:sugar ABC transporter substrate-binding protein [Propionibacteriales bacterium]
MRVKSSKQTLILGAGLSVALLMTACSGTGQESEGAKDSSSLDATIAVIAHGASGDAFWSVVKAGAERAGEDLGVTVQYNSTDVVADQASLIDTAVSDKVDGIVVSMAEPDGLEDAVKAAVDAGVPVITINSGLDQSKEFGALTHIGQSEQIAGQAAGDKFNEIGAQHLVCVIHEAGNVGLQQRCDGAKENFEGTVENLQVDGADTAKSGEAILSALQADDSIDAVLALNGQVALGAAQAIEQQGSDVQVGTFDLSTDVLTDIEDGAINFAIDQQPYVQGYLGVQFLYLKVLNGNDVGGGQPVYSGPAFVTKDNAAEVADFAEQGTR